MKKTSSPLLIWYFALAAIAVTAIVLSQIDPVRVHVEERRKDLQSKLEMEQKFSGSADVVFFGNSLLQSGLPESEYRIKTLLSSFVQRYSRRKDVSLKVVNLALDGRTAWDIEQQAEKLLAMNPRVLVIQIEMILQRSQSQPPEGKNFLYASAGRLNNWIRYGRQALMRPVFAGDLENRQKLLSALSSQARIDIRILKAKDENAKTADDLKRTRLAWSNQKICPACPEFISSREFVKRARARGIKVVIVETPLSQTAARFAGSQYMHERATAMSDLLAGDAGLFFRYPKVLSDDYFFDYTHLNPKGRAVYFPWLASNLASHISETD